VLPAKYMSIAGHAVDYGLGAVNINHVQADTQLFIMQMQADPAVLKNMRLLQQRGTKVVYELDDDLWSIPAGNLETAYWTKDRLLVVEDIIRGCDAAITTNSVLASRLSDFNKSVYVIPNYVEAFYKTVYLMQSRKLRIGWAGGSSHNVDFTAEITEALIKAKKDFDAELIVLGDMPYALAGHARSVKPGPVPPPQYMDQLAICRFDIGIIPCAKIKFNNCRSNLKYLEYSVLGVPSVASKVSPYVNTIENGVNGYVVENSVEEWYEALKALAKSAKHRSAVGNKAKELIKKDWLIGDHAKLIEDTYEKILKG
jgi:glycosyltransferase involved in cell wall biosynthesis